MSGIGAWQQEEYDEAALGKGQGRGKPATMTTASASCSRRRAIRCHLVLLVNGTALLHVLLATALLLGGVSGFILSRETNCGLLCHRRSAAASAAALASSESPIVAEANLINAESPTILTIDNLLSKEDIDAAMKCIETECISTTTTTSDYQEDIFRAGAEEEEDSHFVAAVDRALNKGTDLNPPLVRGSIPATHADSPLEQFLWVIKNHPEAMDQSDIVAGANFIQRRQARQKWESEGGRQLLELSMDDEPFAKAGKRYEMPNEVEDMLLQQIVRPMMPNTTHWSVQDATVVV